MTVEIAPRVKTITLRSGQALTLHEPSILDIQDGEEILKCQYDDWTIADPTPENPDNKKLAKPMQTMMVMLWVMARKDGVAIEAQAQGKWKMSLDEIKAMVGVLDLQKHGAAIGECFYGS